MMSEMGIYRQQSLPIRTKSECNLLVRADLMDNLEKHQREMRERNSAASKRKDAIAMGKRVLILEVKNQRLRERSPQHPVTKQSRVPRSDATIGS